MRAMTIAVFLALTAALPFAGQTKETAQDAAAAQTSWGRPGSDSDYLIPMWVDARGSLKGLAGVTVETILTGSSWRRFGLSQEQVRTKVELRLRQNGIRVFASENAPEAGGFTGHLFVTATVVSESELGTSRPGVLCAMDVSVSLSQVVTCRNLPSLHTRADTWKRDSTHLIGAGVIKAACVERVEEFVDGFCNDYLAANPRPSTAGKTLDDLLRESRANKPANPKDVEIPFTPIDGNTPQGPSPKP